MKSSYKVILSLVILLHLMLLFRLQFTAWPEMLSFPYLINHGYRLYSDFVHAYPPLLTIILGGIYTVFGYNALILRLFAYLLIILSDIFIFKIIFKNTKSFRQGLVAVIFYAVLQSLLGGNMLWFDTALVFPLLLSIFFYQEKKYVYMTIALIVAFLIKQTAALYLVVFFFAVLSKQDMKEVKSILKTSLVTLGLFVFILFLTGVLNDFWLWTIYYPAKYWSSFPGYVDFNLSMRDSFTVLLVSIPPLISLLKKQYLLCFLYLSALIAIYPRFSFFHMQGAIAISAVCFGYLLTTNRKILLGTISILLLFICFYKFYAIRGEIRFFSENDLKLAQEISNEIPKNSSLFMLNMPSHLYVLTNTYPPKPWLDIYGWYYEIPGVEHKIITSFEAEEPEYVLRREPQLGSWYDLGIYEPKALVSSTLSHYNRLKEIEPNLWLWKIKN